MRLHDIATLAALDAGQADQDARHTYVSIHADGFGTGRLIGVTLYSEAIVKVPGCGELVVPFAAVTEATA